jgi:hypothetical protein
MLEIKIAVTLTIREFEVRNAYKEFDEKMGRPNPGGIEGGTRGAFGKPPLSTIKVSLLFVHIRLGMITFWM